jgi:hypothetical protein
MGDDHSGRPRPQPRWLPQRRERRIINLRVTRRWDRPASADTCGWRPPSVYAVLRRYHLAHLADLDRTTGQTMRQVVRRYERCDS